MRELTPAKGAAARPARRVGVPVGWAFGGVAAVAALALGIVGWALWQRSQAPPAGEPPAPAAEPSLLRPPRPRPRRPRRAADRRRLARRERAPGRARPPERPGEGADAAAARRPAVRGLRGPGGAERLRGADAQRVARRRLAERRGARRARAPRGASPRGPPTSSRRLRGPRSRWTGARSATTPLSGLKLKPGKRRIEVALDGPRDLDRVRGRGGGRDGPRRGAIEGHARSHPRRPRRSRSTPRASTRTRRAKVDSPREEALGQLALLPLRPGGRLKSERAGVGRRPLHGQRDGRGPGRRGGGVRREGAGRRRRVGDPTLEVPAGDEAGHCA